MTDEEFEQLLADMRKECHRTGSMPPLEKRDEYEALGRHAEFGAAAH